MPASDTSGLWALAGIFGGFGAIGLYLWSLRKAPRKALPKDLDSTWRFQSKRGLKVLADQVGAHTHAHVSERIQLGLPPTTTAGQRCTPPGPVRLRIDVVDQGFPGTPFVAIFRREGPWVYVELRGSGTRLFPGNRCKRSQSLLAQETLRIGLAGLGAPDLETVPRR